MKPSPEELKMDALREVANVGAGHAARALSTLTGGQRMRMDVPRALKVDAGGLAQLLGGEAAPVVAASFEMTGALSGRLSVVWPRHDADRLVDWLTRGRAPVPPSLAESALSEAANIVASACLNAVGQLAGLKLLPSVPTIINGTAAEVARNSIPPAATREDGKGWVLEARLHSDELNNELLLVPDTASMAALLAKLGLG